MQHLNLVFIIFLTALFTSNVFADESFKPSTFGMSYEEQRMADYLELERNLLESKYPKASTEAWKVFARLYEEYVTLFCYTEKKLKLLIHENPDLGSNCSYYIEKLLSFDSDNPLALCASKGLLQSECKQAYSNQYIARDSSYIKADKSVLDFENKLDRIQKEIMKVDLESLNEDLRNAYTGFQQTEDPIKLPAAWRQLEKMLKTKIAYTCNSNSISFVDFNPPKFMLASNLLEHEKNMKDSLYMQVYNLLNDPERLRNLINSGAFKTYEEQTAMRDKTLDPFEKSHSKLTEFTPKPFWRVKIITKNCFDAILEGLKFNGYLPASICALHGKHSVFCYQAEEDFKRHLPAYVKNPPRKKTTYTLEEF